MAFFPNSIIFLGFSILYFVHPSSAEIVYHGNTILNQVFLFNGMGRKVCGGTIIGEKYVLTAAHCVVNGGKKNVTEVFKVRILYRLGEVPGESPSIKAIVIPKDYESPAKGSDIAILVLNQTLLLRKPNAHWLDLARTHEDYSENFTSITAFVIGQDVGYAMSVDSATSCFCGRFRDDQICAKIYPNDFVQSLEGNSLKYGNVVIGIVSSKASCNDAGSPPYVFTRVSSFYKWIVDVMHGQASPDHVRRYIYA